MKNMKIDANGTEIRVMGDVVNEEAYISLTDIAKYGNKFTIPILNLSNSIGLKQSLVIMRLR